MGNSPRTRATAAAAPLRFTTAVTRSANGHLSSLSSVSIIAFKFTGKRTSDAPAILRAGVTGPHTAVPGFPYRPIFHCVVNSTSIPASGSPPAPLSANTASTVSGCGTPTGSLYSQCVIRTSVVFGGGAFGFNPSICASDHHKHANSIRADTTPFCASPHTAANASPNNIFSRLIPPMILWNLMDGVIVVDKSTGWTSHDVVNKMRRIAGTRRIGHLGTLDPAATGVLPLVIGRATRLSQFYVKSDKVYEAVVHFGYSTSTYDAEGERTSEEREFLPDADTLWQHLPAFQGTFLQTPPAVSAKKIAGTPAYKHARRNVEVELKPVEVTVHSLELLGCEGPEASLRVHCSGGTYLRSIAHDLGQAIGCGAFLRSLRRTRSGDFTIERAETIEQLEARGTAGTLGEVLIPATQMLPGFPNENVDAITAGQIRQGRDFRVSPFRVQRGARFVKAIDPDGSLLAIGELKLPNLYHPMMVL